MARIRQVRRADGSLVPFRERKIADATLIALRATGVDDRKLAEELASVVVLFLEKHHAEEPPSLDDVDDLLLRVLRDTGHAQAAVQYELIRRRRLELEERLVVHGARRPFEADGAGIAPRVKAWERARLVGDLESSGRVPAGVAEEIAAAVEDRLVRLGVDAVSSRMVAELRDAELETRGFLAAAEAGLAFEVAVDTLEHLVEEADESESIDRRLAGPLLAGWSLDRRTEPATARAHLEGRLHLYGLDDPHKIERLTLPTALLPRLPEKGEPVLALLEARRLLDGLREDVRGEILLPDLVLACALTEPKDPEPLVDALFCALDITGPWHGVRGPTLRLALPLGTPRDFSARSKAFVDAVIARLAAGGGRFRLDLVYEPEFTPLESATLTDLLALAAREPGARLGIRRGGAPSLDPRQAEDPFRLRIGLGRVGINLPLALIEAQDVPLTDALADLELLAGRCREAFRDRYWQQRGAARREGLQATVLRLGGPETVAVPAGGQEVDLEVWGLFHALEVLQRRGVIREAERPEASARILSFLDYHLGEEQEGSGFRVRLGGTLDRGVRRRFLGAFERWTDLLDLGDLKEISREGEGRGDAVLPVVLPLLGGPNDALLKASFAERVGPGLALPFAAFQGEAPGALLDRLARETRLGLLTLRPPAAGEQVFELQEELFG